VDPRPESGVYEEVILRLVEEGEAAADLKMVLRQAPPGAGVGG
jgi:hypothetical protein